MYNIKSHKSVDGYNLYEVKIGKESYLLANKYNYKNDIDKLVNQFEDILFDSLLIIFGSDSGAYIEALKKNICIYNKVLIIEPNENLYNINSKKFTTENIKIMFYKEEDIKANLTSIINYTNFNRIHVHSFGNYEQVYKEEYDKFVEILDNRYYTAVSSVSIDNRFRKLFFENMISNLSSIDKSMPLNTFINYNKDVPAIIVSAGPSLDLNIEAMLRNKDKLDKYFIIAGNRTLNTLLKNGIYPNLVVSVDPDRICYEMMSECLNSDVPLAFYEYSNKDLVREYQGEKIYISQLFSLIIEDLKNLTRTYSGGSIAHTCIDIARIMGCNPIIMVGQDCAYTYEKSHADNAVFAVDDKFNDTPCILTKDVYQNDIKTTQTLNFFKSKIEEYIKIIQINEEIEFINVSYGANIIGAPHKELDKILGDNMYIKKINKLKIYKEVNIESYNISDTIINYINYYLKKCDECILICKNLLVREGKETFMEMDEDDINLIEFIKVLDVLQEFENNPKSCYLGSYLTKFLFDIRQKHFEMQAIEYDKLTSNFKYQSKTFLNYFKDLKEMLLEVKDVYLNISPKLD